MSDESIPPGKLKRRSGDVISMQRIVMALLASTPLTIPGVIKGGQMVLDIHMQWIEMQKDHERLHEIERQLAVADPHEKRLDSLERWKCVLGWDPPKTRLRGSTAQCRDGQRDADE